jgi:hypothetical protein
MTWCERWLWRGGGGQEAVVVVLKYWCVLPEWVHV